MLKASDYPPGTPIYSYVAVDGTNIHVDSEKLRLWCAEHHDELLKEHTALLPVDENEARRYLAEHIVDEAHVCRVLTMKNLDPVILCRFAEKRKGWPDGLLVDGHHRYVAAAIVRCKAIPCYVLEPAQWEPFQIEGLPNLTEEILRAMPTKPRSNANGL